MAGKPQVTLTLAGDESKLTQAFDRVGQSSKRMADDVGGSSKRVAEDTVTAYDRVGEASDNTYDKFDALESVGRGTTDTMSGLSEIMSGNVLQGSTDLAGGVAALADGFSGALLPAIKAATQGGLANAAATARQTAANVASKAAQYATAAASKALAAGQYLVNAAMRANPIGLVVTALIAVAAGLIYAYKHSEKFRNIVNGAFGAVSSVAKSVFGWIASNWRNLLNILVWPFQLVVKPIWKHRDSILSAIRAVPGAIKGFMKGVAGVLTAPFSAAFAGIKRLWNSTIGGKGFSVPGWVPEIGGKGFTIPYLHTGGVVSGALGSETLAVLKAGERVTAGINSGGGGAVVVLRSDGGRVGKLLIQILKEAIRIEGGNVQAVVGS